MRNRTWYRMDNAAQIFPAVLNSRMTTVFRLSVSLSEANGQAHQVNETYLQKTLDEVIEEYPYFKCILRYGFFWPYLEEKERAFLVERDEEVPCRKPGKNSELKQMVRILYRGNYFAVECSHALTDGGGGLFLLQRLLYQYSKHAFSFNPEKAVPIVTEDRYKQFVVKGVPSDRSKTKAWQCSGSLLKESDHLIIRATHPVKPLLEKAKSWGVSLTEFLSAVYAYSLLSDMQQNEKQKNYRPIRISIPINLRGIFEADSLRNFFLTTTPEIDPRLGDFDLKEIALKIHHHLRVALNKKYLNQTMARNVSGEEHPLVRIIPLALKIPVQKLLYRLNSAYTHSGTFTNLGVVKVPEELEPHVARFDFMPNPNPITKVNMGAISYKHQIILNISQLTDNRNVVACFFKTLREFGFSFEVTSNDLLR